MRPLIVMIKNNHWKLSRYMKVGIIGGGIGGLTLALQLHQRGIECEIWEVADALKPLGLGINLLPHAVREMCALGLEDALAEIGVETSALAYFNQFGQSVWHEARGRAAGYDYPQFSIHRGEFQMLLAAAVQSRLGFDGLQLGLRAEGFTPTEQAGVTVRLRSGGVGVIEKRVDVVVAADGIHSAIRALLHPADRDPLRFSGRMMWRAVTEAEPYLDGRTMFMAGHQDQKFVAYPIGRSRINWIAEMRVTPEHLHNDWNRQVPKSVFDHAFANWKWGWIDIPALIARTEAVYEFPLVDKDPLPRWTAGRLTLLGDAAHPMYPIGSNGSAQAILDARCLADWLAQARKGAMSPAHALLEYEAERLPKTAAIVLRNRLNGPEQVMQLAHERAPQGFDDIETLISRHELESIAQGYRRVAGFDQQDLVKGPR